MFFKYLKSTSRLSLRLLSGCEVQGKVRREFVFKDLNQGRCCIKFDVNENETVRDKSTV